MRDQRLDNLRAYLMAIRTFESRTDDLAYATLYGGEIWRGDLSAHPKEQGWAGVRLPDQMCKNAGLNPPCVSTAAGAYQMIYPTWKRCRDALQLPDFGPDSQDTAAIWLIGQQGALQAVEDGDFDRAIQLCKPVWASMPGNYAKQAQHSLDKWIAAYTGAGGVLA